MTPLTERCNISLVFFFFWTGGQHSTIVTLIIIIFIIVQRWTKQNILSRLFRVKERRDSDPEKRHSSIRRLAGLTPSEGWRWSGNLSRGNRMSSYSVLSSSPWLAMSHGYVPPLRRATIYEQRFFQPRRPWALSKWKLTTSLLGFTIESTVLLR